MVTSSPLVTARRDAQALRDAGNLSAACDLLTRTLASARAVHDEAHPEVLATAYLLARLYREADDPAAARRVLEENLAAGRRRLGDHDPLIVAMSFALGSVAGELGNRHEARRNLHRVTIAGPAALGAEHWMVRAAQAYLGDMSPTAATHQQQDQVAPPVARPQPSAPPSAQPWPTAATGYEPPPAAAHPWAGPAAEWASRGRGHGAIVVAAVAAVTAALALVVVLTGQGGPAGSTPKPTLAGPPPTGLAVRDEGAAVTISWADPAEGRVPFVVAGGRTGRTLGALATIDPGVTSYTVNGLNPRLDYCFTVIAVYSTSRYATSGQVCTTRAAPG